MSVWTRGRVWHLSVRSTGKIWMGSGTRTTAGWELGTMLKWVVRVCVRGWVTHWLVVHYVHSNGRLQNMVTNMAPNFFSVTKKDGRLKTSYEKHHTIIYPKVDSSLVSWYIAHKKYIFEFVKWLKPLYLLHLVNLFVDKKIVPRFLSSYSISFFKCSKLCILKIQKAVEKYLKMCQNSSE